MDKVTLKIDGVNITAVKEKSILQAALENNIYIPNLCHHPDLKPVGVCRLCMVEAGGETVYACRTPVQEGLEVKTGSPEIDKVRRINMELLVANHHENCRGCAGNGHCALQKIMAHLRIDRKRVRRLRLPKEERPVDNANPFFDYHPDKCVLCEICVHTCAPVQQALHIVGRGPKTKIAFFGDSSICETCGKCVARCPVGALASKEKTLLRQSA